MNEEREDVSLEMKLWMAGYESALDHLERGSRKILKELGKLHSYTPFDGFRAVLEADIRGLHSYRNGWDGLPRPDHAAAIGQIGEILAAAGAWSRGSLLADFRVRAPERVEEAVQAALGKIVDDVGYGAPEAWELTREKIRGRLERMAEWLLQDPDLDLESARAPGQIPRSDERLAELVWIWCGAFTGGEVLSDSPNRAEVIAVSGSDEERPANLQAWKDEDPGGRSVWGPLRGVRFVECEKDICMDLPAGRTAIYEFTSNDLGEKAVKIEGWERLAEIRSRALGKLDEEELRALGFWIEAG